MPKTTVDFFCITFIVVFLPALPNNPSEYHHYSFQYTLKYPATSHQKGNLHRVAFLILRWILLSIGTLSKQKIHINLQNKSNSFLGIGSTEGFSIVSTFKFNNFLLFIKYLFRKYISNDLPV